MKTIVFCILMFIFLTFGNKIVEFFRNDLSGLLYMIGAFAVVAFMIGVIPLVKKIVWK